MDIRFLGLMEFVQAWELQKRLVEERSQGHIPDTLLLLEHPPVYTCGASSHACLPESLPHPGHVIERGGDATYHGPGQLVGYPIVHLGERRTTAVDHIRFIEAALIETAQGFGLGAQRIPGFTGVWCQGQKIASIGVAARKNVAFHGFSLNVCCDLSPFYRINPCKLEPAQMTTLSKLTKRPISVEETAQKAAGAFHRIFSFVEKLIPKEP